MKKKEKLNNNKIFDTINKNSQEIAKQMNQLFSHTEKLFKYQGIKSKILFLLFIENGILMYLLLFTNI